MQSVRGGYAEKLEGRSRMVGRGRDCPVRSRESDRDEK